MPYGQAQQPVFHYLCDDLGRLVAAVDQDGNVAGTLGPGEITLVSPNQGTFGTSVSIFGKGFSADVAKNTISFGGAIAQVTSAIKAYHTTQLATLGFSRMP